MNTSQLIIIPITVIIIPIIIFSMVRALSQSFINP